MTVRIDQVECSSRKTEAQNSARMPASPNLVPYCTLKFGKQILKRPFDSRRNRRFFGASDHIEARLPRAAEPRQRFRRSNYCRQTGILVALSRAPLFERYRSDEPAGVQIFGSVPSLDFRDFSFRFPGRLAGHGDPGEHRAIAAYMAPPSFLPRLGGSAF